MRPLRRLSLLWLLAVPLGAHAADDPELVALRERVAQLEEQNRQILAALAARPAATAAASATPAAAAASAPVTSSAKSRIDFYGFLRLDGIYDSSQASAIQTPFFIVNRDGSGGGQDSLNWHARLTRFGMNFAAPQLGASELRVGGKLEVDFQNGGSESRAIPRMRHAYLTAAWGQNTLLVGQTWDLISPLLPSVNADTLMWNAGNLGDRRPQIRLTRSGELGATTFTLAGALGASGSIDAQNVDGDRLRDGDDAVLPSLQARVGLAGSSSLGKWSAGLSGHYALYELSTPLLGDDSFSGYSVNLDFQLALGSRLGLQGELWTGRNLADFRGGIAQSLNLATGEEIESRGGWLELGLKWSDAYSLFAGVTLDDPENGDLPADARSWNGAAYVGNRYRVTPELTVGLDYLHWETEYTGALDDGNDDRLNLYFIYNL